MRAADAPPAGWYPDPQGGARLRWWDGLDWADTFRANPFAPGSYQAAVNAVGDARPGHTVTRSGRAVDPEALVAEVRSAARSEIERAAQMLGQQMRQATREVPPLISEYANKLTRLVKRLMAIVIVIVVVWIVFQIWAEQSLFDWIGDRIDNLSDKNAALAAVYVRH